MGTMMPAHVDQFRCLFYSAESSLTNSYWLTDKSNYSTVCGFTRVYIQELNAFHFFNFGRYPAYYLHVTSFAEIWDAFDQLIHIK
jgi:hypothetical protein